MTTDLRTTLNLPAGLAARIDDYWHSMRLNSRNEAIRELLVAALDRRLTVLEQIATSSAQPAKEQRHP